MKILSRRLDIGGSALSCGGRKLEISDADADFPLPSSCTVGSPRPNISHWQRHKNFENLITGCLDAWGALGGGGVMAGLNFWLGPEVALCDKI